MLFAVHSRQQAICQNLFTSFLSRLLFVRDHRLRGDALLTQSIKCIDSNIYGAITIDKHCSISNLSVSGFKHKFKEFTGETPRDYINRRKINKAKELLRLGTSITDTTMQLSFNSSDYFSVVIRKYTTTSPTGYVRGDGNPEF